MKKNWSRIYTFGRSASAILTIYNQIFFSRGPSALIFRDLSFLIWFNGFCKKKSTFLYEKLKKRNFFRRKNVKIGQNLKNLPQDQKVVPEKSFVWLFSSTGLRDIGFWIQNRRFSIWFDFFENFWFFLYKIDVLQIARNSRTLWWKIIKFYTQNMPRNNFSSAKTPRNCNF